MDDLLKALTEAVRAGSHLALPAVVGYFIVRMVESLSPVLGFVGVAWIVGRTVLGGMTIFHEKNGELTDKRRVMWDARCVALRLEQNIELQKDRERSR